MSGDSTAASSAARPSREADDKGAKYAAEASEANEITLAVEGKLGAICNHGTGRVVEVHHGSQAQRLGVQVGWTILRIDDLPYTVERFKEKLTSGRPCQVTFLKAEGSQADSDVWLHVYHCDRWTGLLNNWWLKNQDIAIYHVGVEVYGEEWTFLYFEDTWDDGSVSGVIRCEPKCMADYDYQESINLGPTPLNEDEVDDVLLRLHYEYPANTYHLTRRNCLTFAHALVGHLRPPEPFPPRLKGVIDAASQAPRIDATVDYGWSWAKWYMLRKHAQASDAPGEQPNGYCCCSASGAERQSSMWSLLLQPGAACTGKMCPGGSRAKMDVTDNMVSAAPDSEILGIDAASPRVTGGSRETRRATP